jgi:hypothetical protein
MDDMKPLNPESKTRLSETPAAPLSVPEETMPKKSRLAKTVENNSRRTLIFSLLGIIIVIAFIAIFGIPFLEQFAKFTSRNDTTENADAQEETIVLLPPFLDTPYEATNSAEINLTGTAEDGDSVKLYLNGKLTKEAKIQNDNSFVFRGIELKEGTNSFKVKALKASSESKFSDAVTISYRKDAPKITIDYPSEGQGISNKDGDRLQIEGTTDPDVNVTINGFQAVVDDEGKFKYFLPIKGGDNSIHAVATDDAGNKTELDRKFTYNP